MRRIAGVAVAATVLAVVFYLGVMTPSISICLEIRNQTEEHVTIYVINTLKRKMYVSDTPAGERFRVTVCQGDSLDDCSGQPYVVLALNAAGELVYQQLLEAEDIMRDSTLTLEPEESEKEEEKKGAE